MSRHPSLLVGLITGLALGFAGAFGGFGDFVIVLVLGAVGLLVGLVLDGDIAVLERLGWHRDRLDR